MYSELDLKEVFKFIYRFKFIFLFTIFFVTLTFYLISKDRLIQYYSIEFSLGTNFELSASAW